MIQRTKRGHVDTAAVLPLLETGRRGAIQVRTQATIGSTEYVAADTILQSIDRIAEALTGDPAHLHAPLSAATHPTKRK